jgi:hypothetical protein
VTGDEWGEAWSRYDITVMGEVGEKAKGVGEGKLRERGSEPYKGSEKGIQGESATRGLESGKRER